MPNGGHKRGATIPKCKGGSAAGFSVELSIFTSAVLTGIAGCTPHTIATRAITIHMRKRRFDEDAGIYTDDGRARGRANAAKALLSINQERTQHKASRKAWTSSAPHRTVACSSPSAEAASGIRLTAASGHTPVRRRSRPL